MEDVVHKKILAPALVLDLDGTVRRTLSGKPFPESYKDCEIIPGMEERIWKYRDAGYLILGISNQGGVAHGFKTQADTMQELSFMFSAFKTKNPFHMVKQCYHDERGTVEPYNHRSLLRKPYYGILALMESEAYTEGGYIIDWNGSLMIGDRNEDRECAENAGLYFLTADDFVALNLKVVTDYDLHPRIHKPIKPLTNE